MLLYSTQDFGYIGEKCWFFSLWGYRGDETQSCWPGIFIVGEMNIFEHGEAKATGRIPMVYQTRFFKPKKIIVGMPRDSR